MVLKNEEILLTKNEQIFEAISIFLKALAFRLVAQKLPEAGLFLVRQSWQMRLAE